MLGHYYREIFFRPRASRFLYKSRGISGHFLHIRFYSLSKMAKSDSKYDYDYFVIGGGSGGVRSSRIAAQHGARVALAEAKKLGGTCVNVGCVPKKLFCYASHFRELFHDAHAYGWPKIDVDLNDHNWKKFLDSKNAEIQRLNDAYEKNQKDNDVKIIKGYATLKDQHTVVVDEKEYTAKYILLAVGGWINRDRKERKWCLCLI